MSILNQISDEALWRAFYTRTQEREKMRSEKQKALLEFIDTKRYTRIAEMLNDGQSFTLPVKRLLNKVGTTKKRVVYTYSEDENYVLKLITCLLYKYDWAFSSNLYSFRQGIGVKRAFLDLMNAPNISDMCSYKVDVHDYFNSVDIDLCIAELKEIVVDDRPLLEFITRLLREDRVVYNGTVISESHGIMAGVPISSFLANVYLRKMDRYFEEHGIPYGRYSDDIIVFAQSAEELKVHVKTIKDFLKEYRLEINPDKEVCTSPGEPWSFLGLQYCNGEIDISPMSLSKVKAKFRRKARALLCWKRKKGLSNIYAVKAFIKYINRFFYCNTRTDEMTWTKWYFPIITTDQSLKELDHYSIELIRFIFSEKHSKAAYNFRYSEIKQLGYQPLVAAYYSAAEKMRDKKATKE